MNKDDVGMIKFTQSMMAIVQALSTVDTATKAWDGLMTGLNAMLDQKIADTAGDGVPAPMGGSAPAPTPAPKRQTIFDDLPKRKF